MQSTGQRRGLRKRYRASGEQENAFVFKECLDVEVVMPLNETQAEIRNR